MIVQNFVKPKQGLKPVRVEPLMVLHSNGRLLALPANIRLV